MIKHLQHVKEGQFLFKSLIALVGIASLSIYGTGMNSTSNAAAQQARD